MTTAREHTRERDADCLLRADGIQLGYSKSCPVLRGVDLRCARGEIVALVGANGAGKTTLFKVLSGLVKPDAGTVRIAGFSLQTEPQRARQSFGYVPSNLQLYPTLSALENLNLVAMLWEVPAAVARERGESMLHRFGLWEVRQQWIRAYSNGMQQRLALCAALLHDPPLLLLDEGLSGLDTAATEAVRELLRERAARGCGVLFSSHSLELVRALADRVLELRDGRLESLANDDAAVAPIGIAGIHG